jgi:two-component system sensor histidine kinase NreB
MLELGPPEWEVVQQTLPEIRGLTEKTILSIRRLISDLSPAVLQQLGLAAAARQLANRLRADSGLQVRVHIGRLPDLSRRVSLSLYRILQEAFRNIHRHSQAKRVAMYLTSSGNEVRLSLEDDGIGFNPEEALSTTRSSGLAGIRLRAQLLGGSITVRSARETGITSGKPNKGTHLTVRIPLTGEYPTEPGL